MRKKIQDIIRGKVETPAPAIVLPEKDLQIAVIEHDVCQGSFSFYSGTGNPVRGLVTCPDDNLICMTPKFDGKRVQVLFEYHGKNMEEGDEKDGYFVITSMRENISIRIMYVQRATMHTHRSDGSNLWMISQIWQS